MKVVHPLGLCPPPLQTRHPPLFPTSDEILLAGAPRGRLAVPTMVFPGCPCGKSKQRGQRGSHPQCPQELKVNQGLKWDLLDAYCVPGPGPDTVGGTRDPAPAPKRTIKSSLRDFPGGPVVKTPSSQCTGPGFDPSSGN